MLGKKPSARNEALDTLIERVTDDMELFGPTHEEYPQLLGELERLTVLRDGKDSKMPSPDTLALIAGNLLGVVLIVAYEQKHVMTSKAFGTLLRPKT